MSWTPKPGMILVSVIPDLLPRIQVVTVEGATAQMEYLENNEGLSLIWNCGDLKGTRYEVPITELADSVSRGDLIPG